MKTGITTENRDSWEDRSDRHTNRYTDPELNIKQIYLVSQRCQNPPKFPLQSCDFRQGQENTAFT
jgi:hypothetical protein